MADYSEKAPIRIPNLPFGQIVDETGHPTDDELTFRQALIGNLENFMGNEGLVMPTQTTANITEIQNAQNENGQYTCAFGTFIYDSTTNEIKAAIDDGTGKPIFKVVQLL